MALFEGSAAGVGMGVVAGVAAALLAPVLVPVVVSVGRPLLKGAIKGAIMAYGRGQEVVGELTETFEDLAVEARSELAHAGPAHDTASGARRAGGATRKRSRRARTSEATASAA